MSDDKKKAGVLMHILIPTQDYELLKAAGKVTFRSPNREALWRLRRSLARARGKAAADGTGTEAA
jgi:hypothetical protein